MKKDRVSINIKLSREVRDELKRVSRTHNSSIQELICLFAESYIKNPDKFILVKTLEPIDGEANQSPQELPGIEQSSMIEVLFPGLPEPAAGEISSQSPLGMANPDNEELSMVTGLEQFV